MDKDKPTNEVQSKCELCEREKAPNNYQFPEDVTKEKKYCTCIPWETMEKCAELSLLNAESLAKDAELLLKHSRFGSSMLLTIFALEEIGKAQLSLEHLINRKNVSVKGKMGEYSKLFLNHTAKIRKALQVVRPQQQLLLSKIRPLENSLHKEKLATAYVDFNGRFCAWVMPLTSDPQSVIAPHGKLMYSEEEAKKLVEFSGEIGSVIIEDYINVVRTAVARIRAELSKQRR